MAADLYADESAEDRPLRSALKNWFMDYPPITRPLVAEVKAVELIFRIEFGYQLHLTPWGGGGAQRFCWGGPCATGDLIAHDFDIDLAYVSRARVPQAGVLREAREISGVFPSAWPGDGQAFACAVHAGRGWPDPMAPRITVSRIWTSFSTGGLALCLSDPSGRSARPRGDAVSHGASCGAFRFLAPAAGRAVSSISPSGPDWRVPKAAEGPQRSQPPLNGLLRIFCIRPERAPCPPAVAALPHNPPAAARAGRIPRARASARPALNRGLPSQKQPDPPPPSG